MKQSLLVFFICYFYCSIYAQIDGQINIGIIDSIESKILNERRKLWIHVPAGYEDGLYSKQRYPVVYLLDGDAHFNSVVGMLQQLSSVNGNTICPKMIVVGIPNTNRTRDLTPTKGTLTLFTDSTMVANSGGGEDFISFIENELAPYIDSTYPTQSYKMLIGHSLGGLMVMNTLIHHPDLFDSYISIDPSMWWDDWKLLNEIKQKTLDEKYKKKKLYLGIANTMSPEMDVLSVQKDTTFETEHIRSILQLNNHLGMDAQKNLTFKGKYYEEDDHGSVPLIAEYDGLRFIFDFYRLKLEMQDYLDPESEITNKIKSHYAKLSQEFGVDMKPDEAFVNGLGYQFLSMNQNLKAEQLFELNVINYPESSNVYDSIGDYYEAIGKKKEAIENYKKAIALNKNSYTMDKLKALEKE